MRSRPRKIRAVAACAAALVAALAGLHAYERPILDTDRLARLPARRPASQEDRSVDLHAHLFMKPGMGLLFNGEFFGPLRARNWKSRFDQQANPETVDRSDIGLLVVALYANPLLTWSSRDAIREEIRQAELFVSGRPDWIIARGPEQARQALAQGKRVLVLSLERASWVLENEGDLKEFVDEKGIRIVTFLHLTDDRYGGVAFMKGYHQLATPWRWFVELFWPRYAADGTKVNARGLTDAGREMAQKLIARGVWLDLSHSSDASQLALSELVEKAGQPLLYTHGGVRKFTRTERGMSEEQLERVRRSGGIVGICPSEDTVNPTTVPRALCGDASCPGSCNWGLPGFVTQYAHAARAVGAANVFVGSDFNGAVPHLHPSCGTATGLDVTGLWNISQMPELWEAARRLGAPLPEHMGEQIETFLKAWSRVAR